MLLTAMAAVRAMIFHIMLLQNSYVRTFFHVSMIFMFAHIDAHYPFCAGNTFLQQPAELSILLYPTTFYHTWEAVLRLKRTKFHLLTGLKSNAACITF